MSLTRVAHNINIAGFLFTSSSLVYTTTTRVITVEC